jgi:hypothetical protein
MASIFRNKHVLLSFMFIAYAIPIYLVYSHQHKESISSVVSGHPLIFLMMMVMGFFTVLYERTRNDYTSLIYILALLVGLYGILLIKETYTIHYFFATLVFASIIGFMYHHCCQTECKMLNLFFIIQVVTFVLLAASLYLHSPYFFHLEVLLLLNFALYYLYLHIFS